MGGGGGGGNLGADVGGAALSLGGAGAVSLPAVVAVGASIRLESKD